VVAHLDRERVHAETLQTWREWLIDHHQSTDGVWLVSWRSATGKPSVPYPEAVEEALTVGWVDSHKRVVDDERSMLWFTRRQPSSAWSRSNKERVERPEQQGRMLRAGRLAVAVAVANGSWTLLDDVDNRVVPDDLQQAFHERVGARDNWDSFPPSTQRALLGWIVQAKTTGTRAKRIAEIADKAAGGERANQWPRA
jgi:uncharacterized protein YdeI (YjbR/CyaY-like superfamily)